MVGSTVRVVAWAVGAAALGSGLALAATIPVDTVGDDNTPNGNCSLREAVLAAITDSVQDACPAGSGQDTVVVPAGVFTLILGEIDLSTGLVIAGAGQERTFIDGGGATEIFRRTGLTAAVEIRDLTIRNGRTDPGGFGGALVQGSTYDTTLRRVTIKGCSTDSRGGAIYIGGGTVELIDSVLEDNEARDHPAGYNTGGAIYMGGGDLEAVRTVFRNNRVWSGTADPQLLEGAGGAIHKATTLGSLSFENCSFVGNSGRVGGAIGASGDIVIAGSTFSENNATYIGGALAIGDASIVNSTFSANRAGVSDPSKAGHGGAITTGGRVSIHNSTFVDNTRYSFEVLEGNHFSRVAAAASVFVENSILTVSVGSNCYESLGSGGYNIASDTSCGLTGPGDLDGVDPLLGGLAFNGGPTRTHEPLPGSPGIDAGNPSGCTWDDDVDGATAGVEVLVDQRGFSRTWDAGVGGPICDAGSVEFGAADPIFADGFESGDPSGWSAASDP